jgi:hypothetical protein
MTAQHLTIESKHRQDGPYLASMADFTCRPGEAVDAAIVCADPSISLYCLDDETQRAIFVQLPVGTDLAAAPFLYQTQYDLAQRLIAVPYATFCQLGQALPLPETLVFIHTPGRSGTTLLSHALNCVEDVVSLAEPDVLSQFVHLRHEPARTEADLRALLDCSLRFMLNPATYGRITAGFLKLRGHSGPIMDLYEDTFPFSKSLFVYRDAASVVSSYCRLYRPAGEPQYIPLRGYPELARAMMGWDVTSSVMAYLDPSATEILIAESFTLLWLAVVEGYLAHRARGGRCLAVHYDDINSRREEMIGVILAACGVKASLGPEVAEVFTRDAQAGTFLAREVPDQGNQQRLTTAERAALDRILARHPVVRTSDFEAPGTLRP